MKNHFHMVLKSEEIEIAIQSLKSYTAKQILYELESDSHFSILISPLIPKPRLGNERMYQT